MMMMTTTTTTTMMNQDIFKGIGLYRVAQKSKPLPNDQKIVLKRIEACQLEYILLVKLTYE